MTYFSIDVIARRSEATTKQSQRFTKSPRLLRQAYGLPRNDGRWGYPERLPFTNGDRVKLNLKVLEREGVDPTQVVALLRQIAGQPSKRHELFTLAGFIKSGDAWEVGEGFVAVLLNKIYADKSAQQSLQRAA